MSNEQEQERVINLFAANSGSGMKVVEFVLEHFCVLETVEQWAHMDKLDMIRCMTNDQELLRQLVRMTMYAKAIACLHQAIDEGMSGDRITALATVVTLFEPCD